jgi:WD40 repeat protein
LTVAAHTARINTIEFSHADARMASGGDDGILAVYDTRLQRRVASQHEDKAVSVLAWSTDDCAILVGLVEVVNRSRTLGIRLAFDDTGCGFADFDTVRLLRPDIVKLCITT